MPLVLDFRIFISRQESPLWYYFDTDRIHHVHSSQIQYTFFFFFVFLFFFFEGSLIRALNIVLTINRPNA